MVETEAVVYFAIKTDDDSIEEQTINNFIGLKPTKFIKKYEKGNIPKCTIWEFSTETLKNPNVSEMIDNVISVLSPVRTKLKEFKKCYPEIYYVLEIVIYHGDLAEGFCLDSSQLFFLVEIDAEVDVDQYNYK